jgi:hypothetical protein
MTRLNRGPARSPHSVAFWCVGERCDRCDRVKNVTLDWRRPLIRVSGRFVVAMENHMLCRREKSIEHVKQ